MNIVSRSLAILLSFGPWIFSSLVVKQIPPWESPAGPELNSSKSLIFESQKRPFWCVTATHGSLHFWRDTTMVDFSLRSTLLQTIAVLFLGHVVGNPTHQVKGIMGGSVLFPANVSQGITVEKTEWDFRPQRHGIDYWLGEFSHGKWEYRSPTDRFGQRLDMVDETTLRIKDLELDDGGIYNTRIWLTKSQFQEQRFSLTVYELVPTPQIDHHVESKTPGGCNVTLRCHTPGREELKVSWETGNPHEALGKGVNQYQVSDNGRELYVSYWSSSFDSKFTCQISNPVDQKRASFNLLKICQSDEGRHLRLSSWSPWLIPSITVLLVTVVMVMAM